MADAEFLARAQARAARETAARTRQPAVFEPPGSPVPEANAARPQLPQKAKTQRLHDDLAEVINTHAASPETVLMALELLRHQALAPRLRQMALE